MAYCMVCWSGRLHGVLECWCGRLHVVLVLKLFKTEEQKLRRYQIFIVTLFDNVAAIVRYFISKKNLFKTNSGKNYTYSIKDLFQYFFEFAFKTATDFQVKNIESKKIRQPV